MATLKAPSVTVAFLEQAASAIERGERGVIAMLVVDATAGLESDYTIYDVTGIPDGLAAANKTAVKLALKGYVNAPQKILLHVITSADDYDEGLAALATMKWNYLVCPTAESDGVTNDIISWISAQRRRQPGHHQRGVLCDRGRRTDRSPGRGVPRRWHHRRLPTVHVRHLRAGH